MTRPDADGAGAIGHGFEGAVEQGEAARHDQRAADALGDQSGRDQGAGRSGATAHGDGRDTSITSRPGHEEASAAEAVGEGAGHEQQRSGDRDEVGR